MKILLLGKDGQVGWELQRSLSLLGEVIACNREQANLEDLAQLKECIREHKPELIVNAAAYTAVDKAESDSSRARAINTDAVSLLASECRALNAWLVHYSTDYVFDGSKQSPYIESDPTSPQSVYGKTKRDGEDAITASGCRHLILRTSWVFASRGNNFAKTMLRLARERDELNVVCDQIGAPTSAELIADVTALCLHRLICNAELQSRASGIYHLSASGEVSWHGYAQTVLREAAALNIPIKVTAENVRPIPAAEYPLPAKRPANSKLDTHKLCTTFDITLPPWQYHVKRTITELCRTENQ